MPHSLWVCWRHYQNIAMLITVATGKSFSLSDNKTIRLKRFVTFVTSKSAA